MDYSLLFIKIRNPDYQEKGKEEVKEVSNDNQIELFKGNKPSIPKSSNAPPLLRMPALVYVRSKQGKGGKLELRETLNLMPVLRA